MADEPAGPKPAADAGTTPDDDEPLREGGKRALDAERTARREAEKKARQLEERVHELETAETRREVAAAKGLSEAQAKRLAGSTREELEADADELLEAFGGGDGDKPSRKRPTEKLRGGASSEEEAEPDAGKVADRILDRGI